MTGKIIGVIIVVAALIAGVAIYWLQVYAFYEDLPEQAEIRVTGLVSEAPEPLAVENFRAIDADSSPLRYRACFTSLMSDVAMSETYEMIDNAEPRTAPDWFDCFDAVEIGQALERGEAMGFMGVRDIHQGFDRVIAVFPDGRGYSWHQPNEQYQD